MWLPNAGAVHTHTQQKAAGMASEPVEVRYTESGRPSTVEMPEALSGMTPAPVNRIWSRPCLGRFSENNRCLSN
jgi:hypothetical protein